ncbi:hypothetical protein Q3G72_018736 [Acer saccharum]|nr:hypothetical protein Q3G72_018736 [Acer saccharum]
MVATAYNSSSLRAGIVFFIFSHVTPNIHINNPGKARVAVYVRELASLGEISEKNLTQWFSNKAHRTKQAKSAEESSSAAAGYLTPDAGPLFPQAAQDDPDGGPLPHVEPLLPQAPPQDLDVGPLIPQAPPQDLDAGPLLHQAPPNDLDNLQFLHAGPLLPQAPPNDLDNLEFLDDLVLNDLDFDDFEF